MGKMACKIEINFYNARMLTRKITVGLGRTRSPLQVRLQSYPAVALVGPRQCGKTTLARLLGGHYYDLEQQSERLRLDIEWEEITKSNTLIILDEAQTASDVFPRLRATIDNERTRNGRFLLLGSVSPSLMIQVSESLAGRLSVLELTPLSWAELPDNAQRQRLWLCGGYPDGCVLNGRRFPLWQQDYLTLLMQRDLPAWGLPAKAQVMRRLVRMLAISNGMEWNASQIGKSLGLSYHTVNSYVDYLEGAFLARRLPAFHANIRKRIIKRPKFYWRDSGLLHALLNVRHKRELLTQPWIGASWEGFVIEQILTAMQQAGRPYEAWYLRTSDQKEIDLVLETASQLWALEIKLTTNPSRADMERLNVNATLIGADQTFLICRRNAFLTNGSQTACDLDGMIAYIFKTR